MDYDQASKRPFVQADKWNNSQDFCKTTALSLLSGVPSIAVHLMCPSKSPEDYLSSDFRKRTRAVVRCLSSFTASLWKLYRKAVPRRKNWGVAGRECPDNEELTLNQETPVQKQKAGSAKQRGKISFLLYPWQDVLKGPLLKWNYILDELLKSRTETAWKLG